MSKYLSRGPFGGCGAYVAKSKTYARGVVCSNPDCAAVVGFYGWTAESNVVKRYNRRAVNITSVYALVCAAVLLAAMALTLLFVVQSSAADQAAQQSTQAERAHFAAPVVTERVKEDEKAAEIYTDADARALAQMAWGECRGVGSLSINGKAVSGTCQKAATMWVALNRYDAGFEDSIVDVVAAPYQFVGYSAEHPIDEELLALAYDVLEHWSNERQSGATDGRIIPADYFWFVGDGQHNHFTNKFASGVYYAWEMPDIYAEEAIAR